MENQDIMDTNLVEQGEDMALLAHEQQRDSALGRTDSSERMKRHHKSSSKRKHKKDKQRSEGDLKANSSGGESLRSSQRKTHSSKSKRKKERQSSKDLLKTTKEDERGFPTSSQMVGPKEACKDDTKTSGSDEIHRPQQKKNERDQSSGKDSRESLPNLGNGKNDECDGGSQASSQKLGSRQPSEDDLKTNSSNESQRSLEKKDRPRNTDARRRLQELEENVVAKTRLDPMRPTEPGAFAEARDGSLNQIQKDEQLKNRLRRGRSQPPPADIDANGGAQVALSRLERDVRAKSRAGRPAATVPGAFASGSESPSATVPGAFASTTGSQRASKKSARSSSDSMIGGAGDGGSSAARGSLSRTPSVDQRATLTDLEGDALAKSRARAGIASASTVDPAARKIAAHSAATRAGESAYSNIRELERDVLSKSNSRSRSASRSRRQLASVSEELSTSDSLPEPDSSFGEPQPSLQLSEESVVPREGSRYSQGYSSRSSTSEYSERPLGRASTARITPAESHTSLSLGASEGGSNIPGENDALQAFVADPVVSATGVAIVLSDEDQLKLAKKKHRRYLLCGCIGFVIVTIAIVVPLVVVLGNNSSDATMAPTSPLTSAPSPIPTLPPTSGDLKFSVDFLTSNGISKLADLTDREAAQFRAMEWVSDIDPLALDFNSASESYQWVQRYILATFYFATGGDSWEECSFASSGCATSGTTWLAGDHECDWLAVQCTESKVVTGITFLRQVGNNLDGTLPEELFLLTDLQALILRNNNIQGTMSDSWGQLSNLLTVMLSENGLSGTIPEIFLQNAVKLGRLDLAENSLVGEIPELLSEPPLLQLRLEGNFLNGTLPESLFGASALQDLRLSGNALSGTLSDRVGNLASLADLQLHDNRFIGPVPQTFAELTELHTLTLHGNQLTGSIKGETCANDFTKLTADCNEIYCTCCTECF